MGPELGGRRMCGSRLVLLGGFRLYRDDGTAIPLTARKMQALLAYLALQPQHRCARDRLAGLLWEGSTSAHARQSLRQLLAELRRALPRDERFLDTPGDDVRIPPGTLTVDVHDFERLLDEDTPEALARAVELYRGELLEGFDPRAPAFDDWLMAERSRLHERALSALQQLLEHEMAGEATARAIRRALHLLSLDPLRESAHRRLMELYARQGHYGAALKQYRVCQQTLRRELNVPPEDATERVFMEQRQGARRGATEAPTAPTHADDHCAPSPLPGRGRRPYCARPSPPACTPTRRRGRAPRWPTASAATAASPWRRTTTVSWPSSASPRPTATTPYAPYAPPWACATRWPACGLASLAAR